MPRTCPIGFTPEEILEVRTSLDAHLPESEQVIFLARALTPRQLAAIRAVWAAEMDGADAENAALNAALLKAFTGWKNQPTDEAGQPLPWSADGLDAGLTTAGKYQILKELGAALYVSESLKKKSRSSPASAPAPLPIPTPVPELVSVISPLNSTSTATPST